jgi:hypothetical protein
MNLRLAIFALTAVTLLGCHFEQVSPVDGPVPAPYEVPPSSAEGSVAPPKNVTLPRGDLALADHAVVTNASCRPLFFGAAPAWIVKRLAIGGSFERYCAPGRRSAVGKRTTMRFDAILELETEHARTGSAAALLAAGYLLAETGYEDAELGAPGCFWCERTEVPSFAAAESQDFSGHLRSSDGSRALDDFHRVAIDDAGDLGWMATYFALRLSADMGKRPAGLLETFAKHAPPKLETREPFAWLADAAEAWGAKDAQRVFSALRDAP